MARHGRYLTGMRRGCEAPACCTRARRLGGATAEQRPGARGRRALRRFRKARPSPQARAAFYGLSFTPHNLPMHCIPSPTALYVHADTPQYSTANRPTFMPDTMLRALHRIISAPVQSNIAVNQFFGLISRVPSPLTNYTKSNPKKTRTQLAFQRITK